MTISVGDRLPEVTLLRFGEAGPEEVALSALTAGKKVAIFGVPGAFTPTCDSAHVPSFIRTAAGFAAKGVSAIYCVSVNDAFVMKAWGESTGATAAGLGMLADPKGDLARGLGLEFDAPGAGLYGRTKRYAMLVEDGVVTVFHPELGRGVCETSSGEALLAAI